jgi:hypothetical protein
MDGLINEPDGSKKEDEKEDSSEHLRTAAQGKVTTRSRIFQETWEEVILMVLLY